MPKNALVPRFRATNRPRVALTRGPINAKCPCAQRIHVLHGHQSATYNSGLLNVSAGLVVPISSRESRKMSNVTAKSKKNATAIQIKAREDGARSVVLHPENSDLFVRTGNQVIDACRLGISLELWLQEMRSMCDDVSKWASDHSQHIRSCFCAPRGARVALYFSPKSRGFDFDLADELAALNGKVVKSFNVGMVEVRQVPWEELDRFLDVAAAVHVYGDKPSTRPAVEAQS